MQFLLRVARSYRTALEVRPMLTQSITSGVLYACGDGIAQKVERQLNIESPGKESYNWSRTLRMSFFGAVIGGPLMCVWYQQLDRATTLYRLHFDPVLRHEGLSWLLERTPGLRWVASLHHARELPSVWTDVSAKLVADLAFFTPAFINLYLLSMGVLEGKAWSDIRHKLSSQFHNAWGVCMMLWLPVQLVNFRFVPVEFQGVVVGAANVVWKTILSFMMHWADYNTGTFRELRAAKSESHLLESDIALRDNRIRELEAQIRELRVQIETANAPPTGRAAAAAAPAVTQHGASSPTAGRVGDSAPGEAATSPGAASEAASPFALGGGSGLATVRRGLRGLVGVGEGA